MNKQAIPHLRGNTQEIDDYLNQLPGYFPAGLREEVSAVESLFLAQTDQVEFTLKRYLAGETPLQTLFEEITAFLALDEAVASQMIAFCLQAVSDTLVTLEAYELLGRYQAAQQAIKDKFHIQPLSDSPIQS